MTIGVLIDGSETWHAPAVSGNGYDTLCGIDANDPAIGHGGTIPTKRGQKITCLECYTIWSGMVALRLRRRNFKLQ